MIFEERKNLRPYEYPHLMEYVDAMRNSYWIHTEFNYTSDIHDYSMMSSKERDVFRKTMLAIAQVEVAVKSFWADLHKSLPKPEIASVGITFGESEVRHENQYAHILDILGLQDEFNNIESIPCMKKRMQYLSESMKSKSDGRKGFVMALIFFSLFIENVSLFSQFFIAMSYNKHKNMMKGMSNGIEASTKEENLHGQFGCDIINIIMEEYPDLIGEEDKQNIYHMCEIAYQAEEEIINWIFSEGDLDFISAEGVKDYVKSRINRSLNMININNLFSGDNNLSKEYKWFDDEILVTKHTDFFNKRSINYTKRDKSFNSSDLF